MKDNKELFLDKWWQIKTIVDNLEFDVQKHGKGFSAPGVRVRKTLRILKRDVYELIKISLDIEKDKRNEALDEDDIYEKISK